MSDNIEVTQRAGLGSEVTQIGTQIVYEGLSPAEACKLATDLFAENFPKLQDQAMKTVNARVDELMATVAKKLEEKNTTDMAAFSEPDVQYAVCEAQKSYARFGTKEMLATLSSLIANRVEYNNDNICLKVAIDKAIEISGLLTRKHLDYLALLFSVSQVKFGGINDIEQLKSRLLMLNSFYPKVDTSVFSYLNLLGCLQLGLVDVSEVLGKAYNLPKDQVKTICPDNILQLTGDYTTSHVGTILAITHLEATTPFRFNPEIWVHN